MLLRATAHITDAMGTVIEPGIEFEAPGDDERINGFLALGLVVPVYQEPMTDEQVPMRRRDKPAREAQGGQEGVIQPADGVADDQAGDSGPDAAVAPEAVTEPERAAKNTPDK